MKFALRFTFLLLALAFSNRSSLQAEDTSAQASEPVTTLRAEAVEDPVAKPIAEPVPVPNRPRGEYYVAHRYYEEKGTGWGWIKKPNEGWSSAQWVALKESPHSGNKRMVAPFRNLKSRSEDNNFEYKFYGEFANYMAYDPHLDEKMAVFILQNYESLGEAKPLDRKPGPPGRFSRSHRSRASSRETNPILTGPENDSF